MAIGLGVVTACSSPSADTPEDTGSAGAFPVTIDHIYGSTTIERKPTRIVTLGVTDADPVLALGTTPLAVTGYSFYPDTGIGPWAMKLVKGDKPARLASDSEPNIEQIATLAPDLIIGVMAGFDKATYDKLSKIAPVIARPAKYAPYTVPRAESTRMIATAMGQLDDGEKLIKQAEDAFAKAAAEHPEFAGKTATVVLPYDGKYGAYLPGDSRGRVVTQLGFTVPKTITDQDNGKSFFVEVSREQVALLDGDVLVMLANTPETREFVDKDTILQAVPVVAKGRMVITDTDTRGAMTYNSVLSIPYVIDRLVPELAKVLAS